jgi:hypothetical protein
MRKRIRAWQIGGVVAAIGVCALAAGGSIAAASHPGDGLTRSVVVKRVAAHGAGALVTWFQPQLPA